MLEGLQAAHTAGIIHRDLKPDNIFILREKAGVHDYVKIIDFGISKFNQLSGDGMKMTRTGAVMGTPYYMSPEQASGSAEADQRSDIYSVGVILYEAVTGRVPFDAGTFNQLMFKIVLSEVPPPETIVPDLDPAFSSIIAKSMTRDLTQRFQTTADFIRALDAWVQSGAAVSVPPAADAAAAGLLPANSAAGRAAMGSQANISQGVRPGATAAGTSGNWASSQPDVAPAGLPKKSNAGLVGGPRRRRHSGDGWRSFRGLFSARQEGRARGRRLSRYADLGRTRGSFRSSEAGSHRSSDGDLAPPSAPPIASAAPTPAVASAEPAGGGSADPKAPAAIRWLASRSAATWLPSSPQQRQQSLVRLQQNLVRLQQSPAAHPTSVTRPTFRRKSHSRRAASRRGGIGKPQDLRRRRATYACRRTTYAAAARLTPAAARLTPAAARGRARVLETDRNIHA